MKKIFACIFAVFLMCGGIMTISNFETVYAENLDREVLNSNDERLESDYLDFYSIGVENFDYQNNGGELNGGNLSNAFDRDFSTYFKSAVDNSESFKNSIDITFNDNVEIDRIMYGSETVSIDRGYPVVFNVYKSEDGEDFDLIKSFSSNATSNIVIFNLGQVLNAKYIRLEYETVNNRHKYVATAREIIFLQPEIAGDIFESYAKLFLNYSQTLLSTNYNSLGKIETLKNDIQESLSYVNNEITKSFERAKNILNGLIKFDSSREFSTNPNSENVIEQYGNVTNYSRGTLKMSFFGTNRQVTGITAKEGEIITVYVEADKNQPLPELYFSQTENYYNGWLSNRTLLVGKNSFVTPNLKNENYSREVVTGGALYLVNPYTADQQSQNIKIYIEGGESFPVFFMGDDESKYKQELSEYYSKLQADRENVFNITELVSNHIILTVTAQNAYDYYINKNYSPESALQGWDEYMKLLLEFGGVTFDKGNDLYNPIHEYLNTNIRIVQNYPGGAAYAFYEHVGIYTSWESTALIGSGFGWGYSHELGHMFDIPERQVGECSNNMWSKYYETAIAKLSVRGNFSQTLNALCGPEEKVTDTYFNSNRLNFLIWWYIETYHNGYWAELENCYRGFNKTLLKFLSEDPNYETKIKGLNSTEKQVFYSSLIVGIDLSYYFERWGYNLVSSQEIFKYNTASDTFRELMSDAVNKKYVNNKKQPKLWLQDKKQYNILQEIQKLLYSGKEKVSINKVLKGTNSYSIILNEVDDERFLGYEILRSDKNGKFEAIGFTGNGVYYDSEELDYSPSYKARGYDRFFNTSALSSSKSYIESSKNVCKIEDVYFTTLSEAVKNAIEGDEIILLSSCTLTNLTIDKNLTIKVSDNSTKTIVLSRSESGDMITINSGISLTLKGNEKAHLVLDGNSFKQDGSLVFVKGILNSQYVDYKNNYSQTISGGAIRVLTANKNLISTILDGEISKNHAQNGGAIDSDDANNVIIVKNVNFISNTAEDGSAIKNKGTITINECKFYDNTASANGCLYNYAGGILKLNDCQMSKNSAVNGGAIWIDGYTELSGGSLYNNKASVGGGIYYSSNVAVRKLIVKRVEIKNNTASKGEQIYSNGLGLEITSSNINGKISLVGGNCLISDDCDIFSDIELGDVNLILKNDFFKNIENCILDVVDATLNKVVFKAEGFQLLDSVVQEKIHLKANHLKLEINNNEAIIAFQPLKVVFVDRGRIVDTVLIDYGKVLTLPNPETKNFLGWKNDKEIVKGSELVVYKNLTLTASYKNDINTVLIIVLPVCFLFVVGIGLFFARSKKKRKS